MKHFFHITLLFLLFPLAVTAQERKVHLDISATAGTTGIGGEIAVQPHPWVTVRAGGTYMPHVNLTRHVPLQLGDKNEDGVKTEYDSQGNPIPKKIDKMLDFLQDLTGCEADKYVLLNRHPVMHSAHVLVDLHPLKNKNWHITTGLYFGGKHFITGVNDIDEGPLLTGVNVYNNMYQKVLNGESIMMGSKELPIPASIQQMMLDYGRMSFNVGTFTKDIFDENGNLLHHAGDKFFLEPDQYSEIKADCRVNAVRPFVGFGYNGALSRKNEHWRVGFDAGVMFWGGHPTITMTRTEHFTTTDPKTRKKSSTCKYYDIDITREVDVSENLDHHYKNLRHEINFIKALKIYPVLEFKIGYRIF